MSHAVSSSDGDLISQDILRKGLEIASPNQDPIITGLIKRNFQIAQTYNAIHNDTLLKNKKLQERNSELRKQFGKDPIPVKSPKIVPPRFFQNDKEKTAADNSEDSRKISRLHIEIFKGLRKEAHLQKINCELEQENAILQKKLSERLLLAPIPDLASRTPSPDLVLSPPSVATSSITTSVSTKDQPVQKDISLVDELPAQTQLIPVKSDSPTLAAMLSPDSPSPQFTSPSPMITSPSSSITTMSSSPSPVSPLLSKAKKLHPSPTQIEAERHKRYHTVATDADYNSATSESLAWLLDFVGVLNSRLDDMTDLFSKRGVEGLETHELFAKFLNLYVDSRYREHMIKTFNLDKDERKKLNIGVEYLGGPNRLITPFLLFQRFNHSDCFPEKAIQNWHKIHLQNDYNTFLLYGKLISAERLKNSLPLGDLSFRKKPQK
jgi:hypothetical protein